MTLSEFPRPPLELSICRLEGTGMILPLGLLKKLSAYARTNSSCRHTAAAWAFLQIMHNFCIQLISQLGCKLALNKKLLVRKGEVILLLTMVSNNYPLTLASASPREDLVQSRPLFNIVDLSSSNYYYMSCMAHKSYSNDQIGGLLSVAVQTSYDFNRERHNLWNQVLIPMAAVRQKACFETLFSLLCQESMSSRIWPDQTAVRASLRWDSTQM
ncbi:hypothetical protein VNO77_41981 [Canavalia gladiata]|uniref:Uncharacterized protein n=1 Tax=Canavalia gladiata TaxID=3824 RepID=A0AAN9K2F9_CANGL